ncbi:MAG: DUF1254 domain-containing protein [Rhizobiales bacterium]|nr:DUF1254 domain-containing protein [Hyphomicrobiales bacterium]
MHRLLYALAAGLLGAGIVHIAVLLMLPEFSERDAWSRLGPDSDIYAVHRIDGGPAAEVLRGFEDPLFYVSACRFDLEDGFAHIKAPGGAPFWSASVYGRNGRNLYSFNDRTATNGALDFVVVTPAQMIDIRKELPPALVSSVFVEADIGQGIAVVRTFVPDRTWADKAAALHSGMTCRQEQ